MKHHPPSMQSILSLALSSLTLVFLAFPVMSVGYVTGDDPVILPTIFVSLYRYLFSTNLVSPFPKLLAILFIGGQLANIGFQLWRWFAQRPVYWEPIISLSCAFLPLFVAVLLGVEAAVLTCLFTGGLIFLAITERWRFSKKKPTI
jgi:hypothetical protein